jgi:UDP-2,3-diacylglucosamine pyrophosphatase LpxH
MSRFVILAALLSFAVAGRAQDIVVISDLHMGNGHGRNGDFLPTEDFRWTKDFQAFLDSLGNKVTLVLAGDTFELWENDTEHCASENIGCTSAELLHRLKTVLEAHREEVNALKGFAARGTNRVVIIPGNHDAGILFPDATATLLKEFASNRIEIAKDGYWISERRVLVEHGHQMDPANRFPSWPHPFTGSPKHLERPAGEQFVRDFFDAQERRFPVVDNFTSATAGLAYARQTPSVSLTRAARQFLSFYLHDLSWRQQGGFLSTPEGAIPEWDLSLTRKRDVGFLLTSVADADDKPLFDAFSADSIEFISDDELLDICDSRYLASARIGKERETQQCAMKNLSFTTMGAVKLVTHRDFLFELYLTNTISAYRNKGLLLGDVIYVYGHTHSAQAPAKGPFEHLTVANTGAWQRLISPRAVAALKIPAAYVLSTLTLDRLPACYPFILISGNDVALRYWTKQGSGYTALPNCPDRE